MKALIEIEITGDLEEPLSNESIIGLLDAVIYDGARSLYLDGSYRILTVYKEDE